MTTKSNINNIYELSDLAIMREIGKEIHRLRLEENITQAELSTRAGINRSFLSQVENGRPASVLTLIQILRALQRLDLLQGFFSEPTLSPMLMAKMEKKMRLRASRQKEQTKNKPSTW